MKVHRAILIMLFLFMITGCYEEITGKVVDAETGQPIEGAVVLVEWTKTTGVGLTSTDSYKVIEDLTDQQGKVRVEGLLYPFVNKPHVSVYKKGYVMWNNHYIFPGWRKRTDFKWENNYLFKLEKFKPEYTYEDHTFFIHTYMAGEKKQLMNNAYRWEEFKALQEMRENERKLRGK